MPESHFADNPFTDFLQLFDNFPAVAVIVSEKALN